MTLDHHHKSYLLTKLFNQLPKEIDHKDHGGIRTFQTKLHSHDSKIVSPNTTDNHLSKTLGKLLPSLLQLRDLENSLAWSNIIETFGKRDHIPLPHLLT